VSSLLLCADASSSPLLSDYMMRVVCCCCNGGAISDSRRDEFSKVYSLGKSGKRYIYIHFNCISARIELRFIYCLYILCVCICVETLRLPNTGKRFYCVGILNLKYFGAGMLCVTVFVSS
jgi:hypothetical protein